MAKPSIDWYLQRRNWTGCSRADAFLASRGLAAREVVDARKTRFSKDELPALFAGATRLVVAKGKSPLDGPPSPEAFEAALGPSGNLRAPALRVGATWLVGFDEALWLRVLGSR